MMLVNGRCNKPFLAGPPPLRCPSILPKAALRSNARLILNDDDWCIATKPHTRSFISYCLYPTFPSWTSHAIQEYRRDARLVQRAIIYIPWCSGPTGNPAADIVTSMVQCKAIRSPGKASKSNQEKYMNLLAEHVAATIKSFAKGVELRIDSLGLISRMPRTSTQMISWPGLASCMCVLYDAFCHDIHFSAYNGCRPLTDWLSMSTSLASHQANFYIFSSFHHVTWKNFLFL
jgi:hypothetical protein